MPAPAALGRGAIVGDAALAPHADIVVIDDAVLADPAATVERLHTHWRERHPVSVILRIDPARIRTPVSHPYEPHTVDETFTPWLDRLHFLIWNNNVDLRSGEPVWWWSRKAMRLGGRPCPGDDGDILLPDGTPAWIDGGPRDVMLAADHRLVHGESVDLGVLTPMPSFRRPAAALAADQLDAVAHGAGPARIIAPAGSGKTRVLTERLRHLLTDRGYERDIVVALAYNRRARAEMETRTTDIAPRIQTLNAIGLQILRDVTPSLSVIGEHEVRSLLQSLLPDIRWTVNNDPVLPYIEALGVTRLGLTNPGAVESSRDDIAGFAEAFPRYRDVLRQRNVVDFDEQVYAATEVLLRDGALRRRWQGRVRHLLVDEFQDLRPVHLLLIRLLACPELDVFGVGDDDQVLYGYDGATPRFLIDFARHFPGAAAHALEVNYRCPAVVTAAAATLLTHNRTRIPKEITPGRDVTPDADALRIVVHDDAGAAATITSEVQRLLDSGATASAIAVLARVNSTLLLPHLALQHAGIPLASPLRADILERTGIAAALAYLRIGAAGDRIAGTDISRILRRPSRGLPPWFGERIQRRRLWMPAGLSRLHVPEKERPKVDRLVGDIRRIQRAVESSPTVEVLRLIRNDIGLGGAMALLGRNAGADRSSHLDDLDALESAAALHPDAATFEQWLREQFEVRDRDGGDGVTLATVHSVKGMEWDHVCVVGASDGLLPHARAEDAEEERRIFHVALTRARRSAVVLASAARPSPFLSELRTPRVPGQEVRDEPGHGARAEEMSRAERDGITAEIGMRLVATGGIAGTVVRLTGTGASIELGPGSKLIVRYGEPVTVGGRKARLLAPARRKERSGADRAEGPVAEALRAWRGARARADGVPAYVVMHDATLNAIAEALPRSSSELATISGIGGRKLERYGSEILAAVAETAPNAG